MKFIFLHYGTIIIHTEIPQEWAMIHGWQRKKYSTRNNSTSKDKLEKNQQEDENEIQKLVERTTCAEILSEDNRGDTRRRWEGLYVLRTRRSISSRSRKFGEEVEWRETTTITRKIPTIETVLGTTTTTTTTRTTTTTKTTEEEINTGWWWW